ncbi:MULTISPECIES: COX15/CtaA family protein [unclassified Iodidimonas]|jgi:cytochrome c oxidase assembly protein subunit 15|uniref:COX15/CtaA family protein n=1 Tax=unclassified Iodidimonas TaxID=2626145 RepID=UPI002482C88B|nr:MULTISPECIES: COX15/CtaA family protein [unclassified Iodidimonas]
MKSITTHSGQAGSGLRSRSAQERALGRWLLWVAALVFLMVVVGGITRLTESGLSMVDWRPVTGILPPLNEQEWQAAFDQYKASPEYRINNRGMSLAQFKGIFWWEYGHRLLGRLIGLAYALPLAIFWLRGRVPGAYKGRLLFLLLLGGAQGFLGWFMVKSGLVDHPEVSHYRLTAHLTLAFVIFSALLWTALDLLSRGRPYRDGHLRTLAKWLLALVFLQIIMGGLVAGLKAGYIFNSWPLMDGRFVPAQLVDMAPFWVNLFDNSATVQFDHRMGAYALFIFGIILLVKTWRRRVPVRLKMLAGLIFVALCGQIALGIFTLLHHVPVALGAAHQGGALVVLALALGYLHGVRKSDGP